MAEQEGERLRVNGTYIFSHHTCLSLLFQTLLDFRQKQGYADVWLSHGRLVLKIAVSVLKVEFSFANSTH